MPSTNGPVAVLAMNVTVCLWIGATPSTNRQRVRLWTFVPGKRTPVPSTDISLTASDIVPSASSDGKLLSIGDADAQPVTLWDVSNPRHPRRAGTFPAHVEAGSTSPWFLGDRAMAGHGRRTLEDTATNGAAYSPTTHTLVAEDPGQSARLWGLRDLDHPVRGARLPGNPSGYHRVGNGLTATSLADGTVHFWDVSDVRHPRELKDRTQRFDRQISSMTVTPDGHWVITSAVYRIWAREKSGRWRTFAFADLEGAQQIEILPKGAGLMAVVTASGTSGNPGGSDLLEGTSGPTCLLSLDTDRDYDDLCRRYPAKIDASEWKALFPGIERRDTCP